MANDRVFSMAEKCNLSFSCQRADKGIAPKINKNNAPALAIRFMRDSAYPPRSANGAKKNQGVIGLLRNKLYRVYGIKEKTEHADRRYCPKTDVT